MMNRNTLLGVLSITACAALITSCGEESIHTNPYDGATGTFSLSVDINKSVMAPKSRYTVEDDGGKEIENLTVSDLTLGVKSKETGGTLYYPLADFSESTAFPAGQYTLSAFWGDEEDEGFGKPYCYGESDVNITAGTTTPVALQVHLKRSIFKVSYTDALKDYYNSKCYVELKSDCGVRAVTYDVDSVHRRVYMRPDSTSVYLRVNKDDESCARVRVARVKALPKYIYNVNLDLLGQPDDKGNATLNITFNDATTVDSVITIHLTDAIFADAPTISTSGFTSDTPIEVREGSVYANDLHFLVNAPGGLGKVRLTTDGYEYISGWPESIDLLAASDAQKESLRAAGLGVIGLWKNPDKMAQIDFANVIKSIHLPVGTDEADVKFVLQVEDKQQPLAGVSDEAILSVKVKRFKPTMVISNPSVAALQLGETACAVDLTYNGEFIDENVKMQYKDENGIWLPCTATYTAKGTDAYRVALSDLPTDGDVLLRAWYAATETSSNEFTIPRKYPAFTVSVADADVWATNALISLVADDGKNYVDVATFIDIKLNDVSWNKYVKENGKIRLTGLTPGTAYALTVKVGNSNSTSPVNITTEAALQLPNNSMEQWYTVDGQTKYWWTEYPGESASNIFWDTMNPLTTSEGGNSTSMFKHNGCSYNAYSGTRKTDDKYSGTYAAIIETVGWGSDNTAGGGSSIVKNVTAGELYLGKYDAGPKYGYAFASRPASLSFYYKYAPFSDDDYGYAEISVIDAAGNVLATTNKQLTAMSSYTQLTMPLDYTVAGKAAKIQVIFRSSGNPNCINKDHMSHPAFGNLSDGRNVGSALYIDDITLNY